MWNKVKEQTKRLWRNNSDTILDMVLIVVLIVSIIVTIVGIILGVYWLFWSLWCFVLPQIWPTGPKNFIEPSYWLFVGTAILVSWVARIFKGESTVKVETKAKE